MENFIDMFIASGAASYLIFSTIFCVQIGIVLMGQDLFEVLTELKLEKLRFQMISSNNEIEKASISKIVAKKYKKFDITKICNSSTREFLEDCRDGVYLVKGEKK